MPAFLAQLRTRLVLAVLVFLAALTLAVLLVVRDSLMLSARDTAQLGAQQLLAQGQTDLLAVTRREAELSAAAVRDSPAGLSGLNQRLSQLGLTPRTFGFVVDAEGRLRAATPGQAGRLFDGAPGADSAWLGQSLTASANPEVRALTLRLAAGATGVITLTLDSPALVAFAPLPDTAWTLAVAAPAAEVTAAAGPLTAAIQADSQRTLAATLVTIVYFAALATLGVALAAGALTRPIQTLVAGTRAIAAGDLTPRLPTSSRDELGLLAASFNTMTEKLQQRSAELLKLSSAVAQAGDLIFITDRAGVIEYVNAAFTTFTGYAAEEAVGQTPRLLKTGAHDVAFYADLWGTILAGQVFRAEIVNRKKSGETYIEEKTIAPLKDAQGQLTHFVSAGRDVTERRRTERAVRESEERLRLITQVTADALYEWDISAGTTQWSPGYRTLFGYAAEGAHAHQWWRERVHPDDLGAAVARLEAAWAAQSDFLAFEYRYRRADGAFAHVIDRGFIFYDGVGRPQRMVGAMIDVTDRVQLSEAQARAALEERQRLARELHDSVTQSLYSLTLLAEAGRRAAGAGDLDRVAGFLARLGEVAQQALKEMRLLVFELRPLVLETEGLVGALQHRLDAVEKRAGLRTQLVAETVPALPAALEHGLYRIAQEALNNALKHSGATAVTVAVRAAAAQIELEITDNGRGFDPAAVPDQGGLGLVSIHERAEALGGRVDLTAQPGAGTRLVVRAPL